jgi:hypothetical protein
VNEKTSEEISESIISELLTSTNVEGVWEWRGEKPQTLIDHLRAGKAKYLSQEVWDVVANYLEDTYKKGNKRPKENNYYRDKFIIEEYKKCEETMRDSERYKLIDGKMRKRWGSKKAPDGFRPVGESQIRKIVDGFKEELKLAVEFKNNK